MFSFDYSTRIGPGHRSQGPQNNFEGKLNVVTQPAGRIVIHVHWPLLLLITLHVRTYVGD